MPPKRASSKPLEWISDCIGTTDATVTNGVIELGLRDDEVAEVWQIDSYISGGLAAGANDEVEYHKMISMDPDVIADPSVAANMEDLEIIMHHGLSMDRDLTTTGQSQGQRANHSIRRYNPPVLVGTDMGQVVKGDAAEVGAFWTTVYFTRRRANVSELNQILLKRR